MWYKYNANTSNLKKYLCVLQYASYELIRKIEWYIIKSILKTSYFFTVKKMSHSKLNRDLHYYKNTCKKFKKRLMSTCKNYTRYYTYISISLTASGFLSPRTIFFKMFWSHYLFRKKREFKSFRIYMTCMTHTVGIFLNLMTTFIFYFPWESFIKII